MISGRWLLVLVITLIAGCGGGGSGSSSTSDQSPPSNLPPSSQANNILSISVNGSLCSANSYTNKPCVAVTICTPGTTQCQTISDILLDTGSYGLRIFKQALNVKLNQTMIGSSPVAECIQFGGGTSDWGPVQMASVILANEPAVQVPVQVIDATFGKLPSGCANADASPADAGFNGILGIGFFAQDCGPVCAGNAANGIYYICNGGSCVGTAVPLSGQVQNPAMLLPQDNNGFFIQLPAVPLSGAQSVSGSLVFGIGTQANNGASSVTAYSANSQADFVTTFGGKNYDSFIDSGSNGLFFSPPQAGLLPLCASPNSAWFCPSANTHLTATNADFSGSPSGTVTFDIGNFETLVKSSNRVFSNLGGFDAHNFDWGLPFFFGRKIFVGFEGRASTLGSGPYWAY